MNAIEQGKRKAAFLAVDRYVTSSNMKVGVGSGTTVKYVVERLAQLRDTLRPVCVATSYQSRWLLQEAALEVVDLDTCPVLDVAIDGADEVDEQLNAIKGGGGCHLQEKLVACCARCFVIVCDFRKQSKILGSKWRNGVPIEVIPGARRPVELKLKELGGKPKLRLATEKAGPVITDNGGLIFDCDFGEIADPAELDQKIQRIVGVVETGLFVGIAQAAFIGQEDGSVTEWHAKKQ